MNPTESPAGNSVPASKAAPPSMTEETYTSPPVQYQYFAFTGVPGATTSTKRSHSDTAVQSDPFPPPS